MESEERLVVVLKHLIEHNDGHREDYLRWIDLAAETGRTNVADLVKEAHRHVEQAGEALKSALRLITE